jgi:hypothetical protein
MVSGITAELNPDDAGARRPKTARPDTGTAQPRPVMKMLTLCSSPPTLRSPPRHPAYLAVPTGTTLIRSATVDGIVAQLRQTSELDVSLAAVIHLLQHHRHLDDALYHLLDMARVAILQEMEN